MGSAQGVSFTVLIPARYASTRLPGKPLADIGGKPMIVRVAERARQSGAGRVVVATDDARIADAVRAHGIEAVMTRADHPTGTDRLAEAAASLGLTVDELLAANPDASIATACHPIDDVRDAFNPNVVKVALDARGHALYFSRATIPWARDAFAADRGNLPAGLPLYRHYGLYAYRVGYLQAFPVLAPAAIERFEGLEQLRALWHGHRIVVEIARGAPAPGVDTAEDLARVRALLGTASRSGGGRSDGG